MAARILTCPMCGHAFDAHDTLCAHGCPLGAMCNLVRCPSCEYEFPETPRSVSWLKRLFGKEPPPLLSRVPADVRPVTALKAGESAEVMCVGEDYLQRQSTLSVFGLVPGADITLLQRQPACVVKIGETELALDPEIAEQILVQRRPDQALA